MLLLAFVFKCTSYFRWQSECSVAYSVSYVNTNLTMAETKKFKILLQSSPITKGLIYLIDLSQEQRLFPLSLYLTVIQLGHIGTRVYTWSWVEGYHACAKNIVKNYWWLPITNNRAYFHKHFCIPTCKYSFVDDCDCVYTQEALGKKSLGISYERKSRRSLRESSDFATQFTSIRRWWYSKESELTFRLRYCFPTVLHRRLSTLFQSIYIGHCALDS